MIDVNTAVPPTSPTAKHAPPWTPKKCGVGGYRPGAGRKKRVPGPPTPPGVADVVWFWAEDGGKLVPLPALVIASVPPSFGGEEPRLTLAVFTRGGPLTVAEVAHAAEPKAGHWSWPSKRVAASAV